MPVDSYHRAAGERRCTLRVRRSEFIAIAFPIDGEPAFTARLDAIGREFHDASHRCWAFRLFEETGIRSRSSDAGEPAGSAGRPILSMIEHEDLADTAVVVVRYFGGIKLGTGSLGRAYRDAARAVLAGLARRETILYARFDVTAPFDAMGEVYRMIDPPHVVLVEERFEASNHFVLDVRRSRADDIAGRLDDRRLAFVRMSAPTTEIT